MCGLLCAETTGEEALQTGRGELSQRRSLSSPLGTSTDLPQSWANPPSQVPGPETGPH